MRCRAGDDVAGAADKHAGTPIFDGKTLNGWKQLGGAADYQVVDGTIVGSSRPGVPNSFLVTEKDYGDFILDFDVRQDVGPTNSGVQFRSLSTPEFENGRVHGYQADIDPSPRQWSGGIYEEAQRGWFYTGEMNPPGKALYKFGEWNHYRIEAIGPRLRVWINGKPAADVIDDVTASGFFGLQVHSIDKPEEAGRTTTWKNLYVQTQQSASRMPPMGIFIRNNLPNNLDPEEKAQGWRLLWDGKTAQGWRSAKGGGFPAQGWSLANGELAVQPRRGRRRRHHDRRGVRRLRAADGIQGVRRRQQRHLLSTDGAARSGQQCAARPRIPDPRRRASSGREARHRRQPHAGLAVRRAAARQADDQRRASRPGSTSGSTRASWRAPTARWSTG